MTIQEMLTTSEQCQVVETPDNYWTDLEVSEGKMIIFPTMRVAKLHRVAPDGRQIFITPSAKLLCAHGERPSTILSWICRESQAEKNGTAAPLRNSICDCMNTDNLYFTKSKPAPSEPPAEHPKSLFSFLEKLGTNTSMVRGRVSRHVPHTKGEAAMYLTQKGGHFVCKHHHTLSVLRKMRKVRNGTLKGVRFHGGICDCNLADLPKRTGLSLMPQLGDIAGKYGELR